MRAPLTTLSLILGLVLFATRTASAQVGDPFCLGTSCPCGNDDPDAGCGNAGIDSDFATGATLAHVAATNNLFPDDLTLALQGAASERFGLLLVGTQRSSPQVFGDGLRCIGLAAPSFQRAAPRVTGSSGAFAQTDFVAGLAGSPFGPVVPGLQVFVQGYYRDGGGACGGGFNLTNALPVTFTAGPIELELAGRPLDAAPHFDHVDAFNSGDAVRISIDPTRFPALVGQSADVYVVAGRTADEWNLDASLVDVRGAATLLTFDGTGSDDSDYLLDAGTLPGPSGADLARGYDVVVDLDGDGSLGDGDLIDGLSSGNGIAIFRDLVGDGPYAVVETTVDFGGSFQRQNIFYPANIAELGEVPLLVISHGNGHQFTWYDHIGLHIASYGYVVMSHQNNTNPGPGAASTTTLVNTDVFLGGLSQVDGGVLVGHVDGDRIAWMGHSRGAEGIARAYTRLFTGDYVPQNYGIEDLLLLSSIAPTDFLGTSSNPQDVPFQLFTGAADNDVTGGANALSAQTYHLLTRARGPRLGVTYHGVGHGGFHNGNTGLVATGPCVVGRGNTHRLMKGYYLPTFYHFVEGDPDAEEFLWRKWETLRPIDAPSADCPDVVYEYWNGPAADAFVIDDFQSNPQTDLSSSGASVLVGVDALLEDRLQDGNNSFTWNSNDPMNGMTRNNNGDSDRGLVFEWTQPSFLEFEVAPGARNLTEFAYVSVRACQATRHPLTTNALEDLTFSVTLRDAFGATSTLSIGAYGGGITEPFQRAGVGMGEGWANEFETTRVRLDDFGRAGPGIDLTDVVAIRLEFGLPGDSPLGRIGLDDLELIQE